MTREVWSTQISAVPAQPGYAVAEPLHEKDGTVKEVVYEPIIAWVLEVNIETTRGDEANGEASFTVAKPVTLDFEAAQVNPLVIRTPDGTLTYPIDGRSGMNEEEAIKVINETLNEERKRRREREAKAEKKGERDDRRRTR